MAQKDAACKTCFIDPEAFLADRIKYTNTILHNTLPFLDVRLAAPVVVQRSGRKRTENGPEQPRPPAHAVARRHAADEARAAGISVQAVVSMQ